MDSGGSSRSFGFSSDDVLCSYDDFNGQDSYNGKRSDPSGKVFHESNMGKPLVNVHEQQDEYPKEEIISAVEKCMKKYADNLLRHLEGISGRLSQLEIYCYKLERSMGELRADVIRDQSESDTKLKSLEKHLQEVHRSIQIIRDNQELADTQKELAKLQLTPQETPTATQSQISKEAHAPSSISEPNISNPNLALSLPHQRPPPVSLSVPHDHYVLNQSAPIYPMQSQSLPSELHFIQIRPQIQDPSIQAPTPPHPFPQYQQQWTQVSPQQLTQQVVVSAQQPTLQAQLVRPQTPPTYVSANPEAYSYSTISQTSETRVEGVPFGYGSSSQPQHAASVNQSSFGPPTAKPSSHVSSTHPPQSNIQSYGTLYNIDGARVQTYQSGSYAPLNPQVTRSNPYADMIEKAVGIGYPRDHVIGVFNRMVESGQPVDFNALLDRLNSRPTSGGATRA